MDSSIDLVVMIISCSIIIIIIILITVVIIVSIIIVTTIIITIIIFIFIFISVDRLLFITKIGWFRDFYSTVGMLHFTCIARRTYNQLDQTFINSHIW